MQAFQEHVKVSARFHDKIVSTCAPLVNHFGINNFTYVKITHTGLFSTLCSHRAWMEYYFSENFVLEQPHFRHPKNFKSGIALANQIEDKSYQNFAKFASETFNINFGVAIINSSPSALEIIGFDSNSKNKMHANLLLNEIAMLRRFATYFQSENQPLMHLLEENPVNIAAFLGDKFQNAEVKVLSQLQKRHDFLAKIGVNICIDLTLREKQILIELLGGSSAAEVATKIYLSPRTVESYIHNLKNKLNCYSKHELIKKARELEAFGFLN